MEEDWREMCEGFQEHKLGYDEISCLQQEEDVEEEEKEEKEEEGGS